MLKMISQPNSQISSLPNIIVRCKSEHLKFWENSVSHSRKLELYQKFKVNYETESYLDIIRSFDQKEFSRSLE